MSAFLFLSADRESVRDRDRGKETETERYRHRHIYRFTCIKSLEMRVLRVSLFSSSRQRARQREHQRQDTERYREIKRDTDKEILMGSPV